MDALDSSLPLSCVLEAEAIRLQEFVEETSGGCRFSTVQGYLWNCVLGHKHNRTLAFEMWRFMGFPNLATDAGLAFLLERFQVGIML